MKRFYFAVAMLLSLLTANAETVVLDLSTPTTTIEYNAEGVWEDTYSNAALEAQAFTFTHVGSDVGYYYQEGFSVATNADDADYSAGGWYSGFKTYGNMSDGGLVADPRGYSATSGAPYLVVYTGSAEDGSSYNNPYAAQVQFSGLGEVQGMYVSSAPVTYYGCLNGSDYGRALDQSGDYLTLYAFGIDADDQVVGPIEYDLATYNDALAVLEQNEAWDWFDLTGLGAVKSVHFAIRGSDVGEYGLNSPTYFCMDKLSINLLPTSLDEAATSESIYRIENCLYNVSIGTTIEVYNVSGKLVFSTIAEGSKVILPVKQNTMIIRAISDQEVEVIR